MDEFNNKKEKHDAKQQIKDDIKKQIEERKSDLAQIKIHVENKFQKSLSPIDIDYVTRKFIKYCAEFWLEDGKRHLKSLSKKKNHTIIKEIFNSLDKIQNLHQIPSPFNQLEYYKLLIKHYKFVENEEEKTFIIRFKKQSLMLIIDCIDSLEKELIFLDTFIDFLSYLKKNQYLIVNLKLQDFCNGKQSFNELVENILKLKISEYDKNLTVLQNATRCLYREENLFLIDTFKKCVNSITKPIQINQKSNDGRSIIEVTSESITVSEILQNLEEILSKNSKIEEVHFVGGYIIHIDTDLENEVWQGRNIVIFTKKIKIHGKVIWNVSGKDNTHKYSGNAGVGEDGHGKQGKDGYPGESGGNVSILFEKIENAENLTIISNGGKGSDGQDGGDGRRGKDGKGITMTEFRENIPAAAKVMGKANSHNLIKTLEYIKNNSSEINTIWHSKTDSDRTIGKIIEYVENCKLTPNLGSIFIEAVTNQGCKITFSFRDEWFQVRQAFCFYKGSLGQAGGNGGEHGLGGQGGYAGDISVRNIEKKCLEFGILKNTNHGAEGEKGNGGLYGEYGINGLDVGYLDYILWSEPSYRGEGHYKIHYSDNSNGRIWCPYKGEYADIIAVNNENTTGRKYEERKTTRQNSDRQHHAKAVRKKNISQDSLLNKYSHYLNSIEKSTLQNLRSDLEDTKRRAVDSTIETQEQQKKHTMELKIKRQVHRDGDEFVHKDKNESSSNTTYSADHENISVIIDKLKANPILLDNWLELKSIQPTRSELEDLFLLFERVKLKYSKKRDKQSDLNTELNNIEQLLIDKYKLTTLQEIAKRLQNHQATDKIELTFKNAARYLVEEKEEDKNIHHPILGSINQYLFEYGEEQREKIAQFCREEVKNINIEDLICSIKLFILEEDRSEKNHEDIEKYYDDYRMFLDKRERQTSTCFEAFKSVQSQIGSWIEGVTDQTLKNQLEKKIKNDYFLDDQMNLYKSFNSPHEEEYDWGKCCEDESILAKYTDYIPEKGPLSKSYRELLAHIFDINIRLYIEDQNNGLIPIDNHNPSCGNAFHILYRDNTFMKLNINDNYVKLEEERKTKDYLYAKVFVEIESLERKQELDNYLKNNVYLTDKTLSKNKRYYKEPNLKSCFRNKSQHLNRLLFDEFKSIMMSELEKQLPNYQKITDKIELTFDNAAKYLVEEKGGVKNIHHPILGNLKQYLYEYGEEQRNKIANFCREELKNKEIFKCSMRTFIFEIEISEKQHNDIKKYHDKYLKFLEINQQQTFISFEVFKNVESEIESWIGDITDESTRNQLKEKIENDSFLNNQKDIYERFDSQEHDWIKCCEDRSVIAKYNDYITRKVPDTETYVQTAKNKLYNFYKRFNNQHEQEYDWWKCCEDRSVLEKYYDFITEKGPESISYRELLAHIFDINIRLYTEDQNYGLIPNGNHNSNSRNVIHILYKDNKFIELNIDENYLQLEKQNKKRDYIYTVTFLGNESLGQKQEFDDYLKNRVDSNDKALSNDREQFEKGLINKIVEYFPNEEKPQLKVRLEKLTSQHIDQNGILCNLLKRFSSEGRRVSYRDLCYLINSILAYFTENRIERNMFNWIIGAHSQRDWINEVILLQLENHFERQLERKPQWREYLSKMANKDILLLFSVKFHQSDSISVQCIEDIFHLLSSIPYETDILEELKLSEWPLVLKEKYFSYCQLTLLTDWDDSEKLKTASYYLWSLENTFGADLVKKLIENLGGKERKLSSDVLIHILSQFYSEKWILSNSVLNTLNKNKIDKWIDTTQNKFVNNNEERMMTQLVELIDANANTSKSILEILPKIKCDIEGTDASISSIKTENNIKTWVKQFKNENCSNHQQILGVIDKAIVLKRGFKLRDTQKLTVLALLKNEHNTLAQVSTGEGKSLIVVTVSIIRALRGEKVDVITSSSVLAKRDAEDNGDIYNLFDIDVSHNCSEDIETRKKAYSNNQVVYGDLSSFQRDYLLEKFYGRNILGNRNFENVIVDEVDSMLLDKGNNMLYLSHDIAGLDKLESVYMYIWQWINRPVADEEEARYVLNAKTIKEAVLSDLYRTVKEDDIGKLGPELSVQDKNIIWKRLISNKMLDSQGRLLKEIIADNELNKILSPEFVSYEDRLRYLLNECIDREKCIHLPNYLRPFVEEHLESWIDNAKKALFMKVGQDYVLDVDRTGTSQNSHPDIIILDRDTGTDQTNSQWEEALHQFLQLKHGCKISLQSLKAVFISNVSFFKLYNKLYGLTGTLGLLTERNLLHEIYQVDFITIPNARFKLFQEYTPIICTSKQEWINRVINETKVVVEKKKRSVLIICETVNDVDDINAAFEGRKNVHTYTRDYEEFDITQGNKQLEGGQIIIATNLAGRGTDIKITNELRKAGGLHVCLTYLPRNIRIEQQAFGRAARCGDDGSGQFVIMDSKGKENSNILNLKKKCNFEDIRRTLNIKAYYEKQIAVEENCFNTFGEQYGKLKTKLDDAKVSDEVKGILLQSCLDRWAFWLDKNRQCIKNTNDEESKRNFERLQDTFISKLKSLEMNVKSCSDNWLSWVEGNPVQMVKLGKHIFKCEKNSENAIRLFDEVIKNEPHFSEAAHYYKAFALLSTKKTLEKGNKKIIKDELRKAAMLFEIHGKFAGEFADYIAKFKDNNNKNIIQIDGYEKQKNMVANIYREFSKAVSNILGGGITPQSFDCIKGELAVNIYKNLLEKCILKKPRVKKVICQETLKVICDRYGIFVNNLKSFLSTYNDIDEKEFPKAMKKAISLPSKEAFWKILIEKSILNAEVKYIVINKTKLKEIDPSLFELLSKKIDESKLKEQTLDLNDEQILLNELQKKNDDGIFKKDEFVNIVGIDKYKILKEIMPLSFTKKANINLNEIESKILSSYDSISIEDFINKANITKSDAEKILTTLVERGVLKKADNVQNFTYELKVKFDDVTRIQLPSFPVYENKVKALLLECFIYRLTLQEMVSQIEEKDFPVQIFLTNKPHRSLVCELFERNIIKRAKVIIEDKDLQKNLKNIYSKNITEDDFERMLSRHRLVREEGIKELFDCLLEKEWIDRKQNNAFAINNSEKRQRPLNFPYESRSIDETLEKILDNRLYLAEENNINLIDVILKKSKSFLKAGTKLGPTNKFESTEEMNTFTLNGLDEFPEPEENKWTFRRIFKTVLIVAIIIIFFVAMIYCMSLLYGHLSMLYKAFYSLKGVNIYYLMTMTLKILVLTKLTGYFSYPFITILKEFIYMAFNRRNNKEKINKNRNFQRSVPVDDFAPYNAEFDTIVDNHLQAFCKDISSKILSNIENEVEKHDISKSVERTYKTLGEENARKMLNDSIESVLNENICLGKYLSIANKIFNNINEVITEDIKKRSKTDEDLELFIHALGEILVWSERPAQIAEITTITNNLLEDLDKKIKSELEKDLPSEPINRKQETETNCERFKTEIIDRLKSSLCENVKKILEQHIVRKLYDEGVKNIFKYIEKKLKRAFNTSNETENFGKSNELKRKYNENPSNEQKSSNKIIIDNYYKEKYEKYLLKLLSQTKNPTTFAAIIREGIPMDMVAVNVAVHVILEVLRRLGIDIPGLTIIIEGDNGLIQTFVAGNGERVIRISLRNNHFRLCGSLAPDSNRDDNNCLFYAIKEAMPEMECFTPDGFRNEIANYIETNPEIQNFIRNGLHRFHLARDIFGGRRGVDVISDDDNVITSPDIHFKRRFTYHIYIAGLIQYVADQTNLNRTEVVIGGRSIYFDRNSPIGGTHAAHLIRLNEISPTIHELYPTLYETLSQNLGRTDIVEIWANLHRGHIAGYIDKFQSKDDVIMQLANIDFTGDLTEDIKDIIELIRQYYIDMLETAINSKKYNKEQVEYLEKAIKSIENLSIDSLFKIGKKGYNGEEF